MESESLLDIQEECLDLRYTRMSMIPGALPVTPASDSIQRGSLPETMQPPLLKLRFINSPSQTIFTASRIAAEDGSPIAIELVDAGSNTRVNSDSRLEIVALDADITEESWTTEEFNRYILRPTKGKPPLLVGDLTVTLKNGIGVIGEVAFTENSSWTRSRKFRLGAKVTGGGVVEAISKAFACKELGVSYQKHYPPYSDSDVWRLDNIAKSSVTESSFAGSGVTESSFAGGKLSDQQNQKQQLHIGVTESSFAGSGVTESSFAGGKLPDQQNQKQQLQICGPRPSAPSVHTDLRKKKKRKRVIHIDTTASDFKNAVRQLTGISTDSNRVGPLDTSVESPSPFLAVDCTDSVRFSAMSSKNLQEEELSIGFKESQSINLNEPISVASDVFAPTSTCFTLSASKDYDIVIRYGSAVIRNDDFISHLRAALSRRGISVHEDFDEVDAVPGCRVLIIVLTSTYISSSILSILQHQPKEPRVVYPFFYGISPSDLISYSKNYERFFLQYQSNQWHDALKKIAQMPGYILTAKPESELIDEIVRDALKVLGSNDKEKMIGMDSLVEEILSLLCIDSLDVRSIGIWGTVGVGKTAIAEDIFRRISVQFETCVFLKDFHKEVEVKGQDAVREDFLSKVLEVEPHVIRISDMKTSFLRSRLQRKRVLVILDDVNDFRDAETFLGKLNYFGLGSRIIITSRNRHVFVQCKIDHVYEVKPLDISKSLLLLSRDTLQNTLPHEVYKTLSLELVKFSNGNPQVLQFCSKPYVAWDQLSQQAQKAYPIYIPDIFERSCCGLDDNERSIFLDIACFFRRMNKDDVAMWLDGCGFSAHIGFRSLVDKSLLIISHNMVDMLRFLQATGREIVRQESIDRPGDRSRLWNAEEIRDVFIDNTGRSAIEGIFLDMSQLKFDASPNVFDKMCNLRLLKFYFSEVKENHGVSLPQGLEYLPSKLRLLHWEHYPVTSLPQNFDPKNLVEVNLPNSCVKKLWKGKKSLEKLKKMRLSYSYQLTKLPRLSRAPNLELLDLEGCSSLVRISQSICYLKKLVFLNLKDCSNLESVPSTVDLESLEVLNLSGCSQIENFPEISPNVKELYMGGTMIQEIPSSIKNLVVLEKLDLENSRHLVNLPTSICKLKHLETLNLSGCSSLERFPDLSRKMKSLKSLDLSSTAIKELPSSISNLTALEELRFVGCKSLVKLPDNAWSLRFKVEFRQIDTEKFTKLWNRFGWLKKVQIS